jgi:hypothetical protein
MTAPNRRERELADVHGDNVAAEYLLADYREEIVGHFERLLVDFGALGEERVAEHLDALIRTLRGMP